MNKIKIGMIMLCLFIINSIPAASQDIETYNDISSLNPEYFIDVDSVIVTYRMDFDLETSSEFDDKSSFKSMGKKGSLSKKEIRKLNNYLLSSKSYSNRVAGLVHRDIIFTYFKNNSDIIVVNVSSITRNITLIKDSDIIQNAITPQFEKYITHLLRQKKIWSKEKSFDKM